MAKKESDRTEASFEDLLAEAEALAGRMEEGGLSLEQSIAAYEKGVENLRRCSAMLRGAEEKVKVLLENYNFQVIDLGKNVEPELVLEAVLAEDAGMAGLSALMTTTLSHMEDTVRLLKERAPQCRVMVGGAVLTKDYAEKMRADFYSKDAMGGVRYAERVFAN